MHRSVVRGTGADADRPPRGMSAVARADRLARVKTFEDLFEELQRRAAERPEGSGTVAMLDKGVHAIGK